MIPRNIKLAIKYLEKNLIKPLSSCKPIPICGMKVVEILWPLNELFRPHYETIRIVKYYNKFETKADKAIENIVLHNKNAWDDMQLETWRVLLERHIQLQIVAIVNEKENNNVTSLPYGLPEDAQQGALMLLLLHSMVLPFPPDDRSLFELPKGNFSRSFSLN
jgi:hypothetical protein